MQDLSSIVLIFFSLLRFDLGFLLKSDKGPIEYLTGKFVITFTTYHETMRGEDTCARWKNRDMVQGDLAEMQMIRTAEKPQNLD